MQFLNSLLNSMPGAVAQGLIWGIMAIGVYITFRILDIADLSVDGSFCTGGAVCVILTINGVPMAAALVAALVAGFLAGFITGVLHTKMGIPAILAGILTQLALYSVNLRIMGFGTSAGSRSNLPVSVDKYSLWVSARYVRDLSTKNPLPVILLFVFAVIVLTYVFFGTEIGASLRATGANAQMARAQGINTDSTKVMGLMLSNGLVALSGALYSQYQGFSDINMGRGAIVIGLAAIIIGETLFLKYFRHNLGLIMFSCAIGAVVYYVVIQIILKLGLSTDDLKLLTATVVAVFLAIPNLKLRRRTWKKGGKLHA
ncbi:MAG: ABC transporter permease [Clostridia bacterium]|nr:ABC transporter permease [Clostridia bacterium]